MGPGLKTCRQLGGSAARWGWDDSVGELGKEVLIKTLEFGCAFLEKKA